MKSCLLIAVLAAAATAYAPAEAQPLPGPQARSRDGKLHPPVKGAIPVAFVLTEGATVIDFAGPWEVFQDVMVEGRGSSADDQMPFRLFTVSDPKEPIRATGG